MAPKNKFSEGEKVLCFHGPLIYEAKCLKLEIKEKANKYFIHYAGWSKTWDEWVPESRILKYNDANLQKRQELQKAHEASQKLKKSNKKRKGENEKGKSESGTSDSRSSTPSTDKAVAPLPSTTPTPSTSSSSNSGTTSRTRSSTAAAAATTNGTTPSSSSSTALIPIPNGSNNIAQQQSTAQDSDATKKKRAKVENSVEPEEQFVTKVEVKVKIPDELKPWLVDDFDLIIRQRKLLNLPTRVTVDEILTNYINQKKASKTHNANKEKAILEVTDGIREYFNVMLGTQLLYKFERPQYAEIIQQHPDTPMSQIYGAVHLLRLFVRLGSMLTYTPLDEKSITLLLQQIQEFLKYMQKNMSNLFSLQDYGIAPPEYHRKAL